MEGRDGKGGPLSPQLIFLTLNRCTLTPLALAPLSLSPSLSLLSHAHALSRSLSLSLSRSLSLSLSDGGRDGEGRRVFFEAPQDEQGSPTRSKDTSGWEGESLTGRP